LNYSAFNLRLCCNVSIECVVWADVCFSASYVHISKHFTYDASDS